MTGLRYCQNCDGGDPASGRTCFDCRPPQEKAESLIADCEIGPKCNICVTLRALLTDRESMLSALKRITDECGCTCTGYYKCNGCEQRAIHIAEDAIDQAEGH